MRPSSLPAILVCASFAAAGATTLAAADPSRSPAPRAPAAVQQPATEIVIGELPPSDLALSGLEGGEYSIGEAQGPLLLLFFRGAW